MTLHARREVLQAKRWAAQAELDLIDSSAGMNCSRNLGGTSPNRKAEPSPLQNIFALP
jgi:hypothetical protein